MSKADDDLLKAVVFEWFDELVSAINTKFQQVYEAQPQNARDAAANTVAKVFAYVCMQLHVPPNRMLDLIEVNALMLAMFGADALHASEHMKSKLELPPALQEQLAAAEAKVEAEKKAAVEEKPERTLH